MNYEFKGTPGTWYVSNTTKEAYQWYVLSEPERYDGEDEEDEDIEESICNHPFWNESMRIEHEANAHLISSAPELLQCLVNLNTCLDNYWNSNNKPDSLVKQITKHQQESIKAIHKALNIK